jgi:nitroreductase
LQARSVVIVKDKEIKEKISQAALGQDFIVEAPVVFVICANLEESAQKYGKRGEELYSIQDATIFASYLQLAVTSLDLACCWIGAFAEDEVSEILKLPKEMRTIAIIPVGQPAEKPYLTRRKNLDEIISKEY